MSLHPLKKSDQDKRWVKGRIDRSIRIHPEYHLIVTEGTKTEPEYFGAIKTIINNRYRERIHLEVFGEGTNTIGLFERARDYAENDPNGCRHVWVVYDKDDFPEENFDSVVELCKQHSSSDRTYHAIWSNQCIELWFLLHFDYMQSDICRSEYFPKLSARLHHISAGDYKKNRTDMFEILLPYIENAVRNAKALEIIHAGKRPSASSPCTKVYELIEKLLPYIKESVD